MFSPKHYLYYSVPKVHVCLIQPLKNLSVTLPLTVMVTSYWVPQIKEIVVELEIMDFHSQDLEHVKIVLVSEILCNAYITIFLLKIILVLSLSTRRG